MIVSNASAPDRKICPESDRLAAPRAIGPQLWKSSAFRQCVPTVFAALVAIAFLAARADRNSPEFGRHPDEAAHFITGTLVHDWIGAGFPRDPVGFAMRYYARYPKVALGHWPPLFYGIQAAWFGLFGVSRGSATALTSFIAMTFLLILFECLRRRFSSPAALLALVLVAGSYVFQYVSAVFMADTLVASLCMGALWCYAAYLDRGGIRPALGFGMLSALAILTKQDAIVLAAVPPLAVLARGRWELLKDWRFYLPAFVVLFLCAPYYWSTHGITQSPWEGLPRKSLTAKAIFLAGGFALRGQLSLGLTLLGGAAAVVAARRSSRVANLLAVLAAHAVGVVVLQMATPVSFDPRYRTALIPLSAFLAANAFQWILDLRRGALTLKVATLALVLTGLLVVAQPLDATRKVSGYRQAVEALTEQPGLQVVIVCSDPQGDGAVTAEFRLQHPSGRFIVIRADKVLASATWMNQNYKLLHETPEAVEAYLRAQPVHYLLIDDWGQESGEHYNVLQNLVKAHPDRFPLAGSFPVDRLHMGMHYPGTARLYRVSRNVDKFPSEVELKISGLPRKGKILARLGDF